MRIPQNSNPGGLKLQLHLPTGRKPVILNPTLKALPEEHSRKNDYRFCLDLNIFSEHIRNVFDDGELDENVVFRKFRTTTRHGAIKGKTQSKEVLFYNLDVIISVGYWTLIGISSIFKVSISTIYNVL